MFDNYFVFGCLQVGLSVALRVFSSCWFRPGFTAPWLVYRCKLRWAFQPSLLYQKVPLEGGGLHPISSVKEILKEPIPSKISSDYLFSIFIGTCYGIPVCKYGFLVITTIHVVLYLPSVVINSLSIIPNIFIGNK
jgi:hypothetical protein